MMALFDASNIVFGIFDLLIIFLDTFHAKLRRILIIMIFQSRLVFLSNLSYKKCWQITKKYAAEKVCFP